MENKDVIVSIVAIVMTALYTITAVKIISEILKK